MTREAAEYVLPLRWRDDDGLDELTAYLRVLADWVDVTVVDGSDDELFRVHARAWDGVVRHVAVAWAAGTNGKVRGVLTGVGLARHEAIVLADDDVRYERGALTAVVGALAHADLVKPQNVFGDLPWHARWDASRTLLNRALGADYPGTYGVRRSMLRATGGYDADVLFENLELERTVRAAGGVVAERGDVYVTRRPPRAAHFLSQRVRQAYDSLAQPARLVAELAIVPTCVLLRRRPLALLAAAIAAIALAEHWRRRHDGRRVFPATAALWTPAWLLERGVTSWLALALCARGGVGYGDTRLRRAATPARELRRRLAPLPR